MIKTLHSTFIVMLSLWLSVLPNVSQSAPASLQELSTYFSGLRSVKATFVQYNSNGSQSLGTLYLQRPGRVRFEYEPPNDALVIAGGGQLAVFDPRSNTGPERYPVSQTPLSLILADETNFSGSPLVVGHSQAGADTSLVLQDPNRPEQGTIELIFGVNPFVLKRWIVTDNTRSKTTIQLKTMELNASISGAKFNIVSEMRNREK